MRDHFFIPIHDPGAQKASAEMAVKREPSIWGRSEYYQTPGRAFVYKGIGIQPDQVSLRCARTVFYDSFESIAERAFQGGRFKSTVKFVDSWQEKLREEYRKATKEGDPVALAARRAGIIDLPIPDHVAAFKPLEMPGIDYETKKRFRAIPPYQHLTHEIQENWRVELYTTPHPHRLIEYDGMPHDKVNFQAILEANAINVREGKLFLNGQEITQEKAVHTLAKKHAVLSALLIHLLNHRLNHSFTEADEKKITGTIFTLHNTGPAAFFDFDTISPRDKTRYAHDIDYAKSIIRSSIVPIIQTAHFGRLSREYYPPEDYTHIFNQLVEKGMQYAERRNAGK